MKILNKIYNLRFKILLITIAILFIFPLNTFSEDNDSEDPDKVKLRETEIKGLVPKENIRLRETEISGTIKYPKINFELPWRENNLKEEESDESLRSFYPEIYTPIERDKFIKMIKNYKK